MRRSLSSNSPGDEGEITFADDLAASLFKGRLGVLRDPDAAGWERMKQNPSRTVWRGELAGKRLYLKQFHARTPLRRLQRRLGRCDGRKELRLARRLGEGGVATAAILACGCGEPGWSLSEEVAPATPADEWHAERQAAGAWREVRSVLRSTAGLVARMHAAGVIHEDLHCGNILLRTDRRPPRPVLMDLHRGRRRGRLSRRLRAKNLAQLHHDRAHLTTRTQRLRFLKHYLEASGARGSLRAWAWMVADFARRHARRQYRQRDRRIRGDNRYFRRIELPGGWRGQVILASKRRCEHSPASGQTFTPQEWVEALAEPLALLGDADEVRKDSPSGQVLRRRLTVGGRELDVFIKRPQRTSRVKRLLDCLRPSRPVRAFRLGHMLLARRVPTALPLAALELRRGPVLRESLLITETVDAERLDNFLQRHLAPPGAGEADLGPQQQWDLARRVLAEMGRLTRRLHELGFSHRDLKATNMLVRWSPPDDPQIVLIDLDGLRRYPVVTTKRRFQALMRLNVSLLKCPAVNHAGQLRMLLGYLRRPGSGRVQFKPYWRLLEEWSARKLDDQIRSRRRKQRRTRRTT